MLDIIASPDHVGAYRLTGTLTERDIAGIIADIETRFGRHEKIGVLIELAGLDDVTLRAVLRDLRYGLGKMTQLRRFPREAVVTDAGWVRRLVAIANPLVPFVELRSFPPGDLDRAMAWVAEIEGGPDV